MKNHRRAHHGLMLAGLVAASTSLQCRDKVAEQGLASARATASAAPSASQQEAEEEKKKPSTPGEWATAIRYRLRVLSMVPCDTPADTSDAEGSNDKAAPTPGKFRLGVSIEVEASEEATVSPVLASPKAATLEKDGKVFHALTKAKETGACQDLLKIRRLRPGDTTKGTLVFEAPNESYFLSSVLAFQPPRWGGETRLEVKMPNCFGADCPEASAKSDEKFADKP
jgi:hypothetical protein